MAIFELSVSAGLKTSTSVGGVPITIRREYDFISGEVKFKAAVSGSGVLQAFEIGSIEAKTETELDHLLLGGLAEFDGGFLAARAEKFSHGVAGAMVGGGIDLVDKQVSGRVGLGTKSANVYLQIGIGLDIPYSNVSTINGEGLVSVLYGSAAVPIDQFGYGPTVDGRPGIAVGNEYNALDELAQRTFVYSGGSYVGGTSGSFSGEGDLGGQTVHSQNDWRHSPDSPLHSSQNTGSDPSPSVGTPTSPTTGGSIAEPSVYDLEGPEAAGPTQTQDGYDGSGTDIDPDLDYGYPILLDLTGAGIEITELSRSTVFMDSSGDGLQNRTAWAAAGNGGKEKWWATLESTPARLSPRGSHRRPLPLGQRARSIRGLDRLRQLQRVCGETWTSPVGRVVVDAVSCEPVSTADFQFYKERTRKMGRI